MYNFGRTKENCRNERTPPQGAGRKQKQATPVLVLLVPTWAGKLFGTTLSTTSPVRGGYISASAGIASPASRVQHGCDRGSGLEHVNTRRAVFVSEVGRCMTHPPLLGGCQRMQHRPISVFVYTRLPSPPKLLVQRITEIKMLVPNK